MLNTRKIRKKQFLAVFVLIFTFEVLKIGLLILQERFDFRLLIVPIFILALFRVTLKDRRMLAAVPFISRPGILFIAYCILCIPVEVVWLYYQISTYYYTGYIPLEVECLGTQLITVMETLGSFLSPNIIENTGKETGCPECKSIYILLDKQSTSPKKVYFTWYKVTKKKHGITSY